MSLPHGFYEEEVVFCCPCFECEKHQKIYKFRCVCMLSEWSLGKMQAIRDSRCQHQNDMPNHKRMTKEDIENIPIICWRKNTKDDQEMYRAPPPKPDDEEDVKEADADELYARLHDLPVAWDTPPPKPDIDAVLRGRSTHRRRGRRGRDSCSRSPARWVKHKSNRSGRSGSYDYNHDGYDWWAKNNRDRR